MRIGPFIVLLILSLSLANAKTIYIDYYNQVGCHYCAEFEKVLEEVQAEGKYSLNVTTYEIRFNNENRLRWEEVNRKFGIPSDQQGTPTVVIEDSVYFTGSKTRAEFEALLNKCLAGECKPMSRGSGSQTIITPITAFFAGLISGFNPCLFAVLLFLISYSLGMSENKARLVKLTISFSLGIFAAYFMIGFGLLSFAGSLDMKMLSAFIAMLVILLGLWTLKDYKNPKSFLVETPENIKSMSESLTRKNSSFSAFLLGGLFSLVKAPCVGGIYLSVLNMASSADISVRLNAIPLLVAYNLGLVFPLLFISGAVLFGVPPKAIEEWREKNKYGMRIFLGLTLILIGIIMLWQEGVISF